MAKFLQETIAETGVPGSDDARAAKEFSDFFRKVRVGVRKAVGAGTFSLVWRFLTVFVDRSVSLENKLLLMIF